MSIVGNISPTVDSSLHNQPMRTIALLLAVTLAVVFVIVLIAEFASTVDII